MRKWEVAVVVGTILTIGLYVITPLVSELYYREKRESRARTIVAKRLLVLTGALDVFEERQSARYCVCVVRMPIRSIPSAHRDEMYDDKVKVNKAFTPLGTTRPFRNARSTQPILSRFAPDSIYSTEAGAMFYDTRVHIGVIKYNYPGE